MSLEIRPVSPEELLRFLADDTRSICRAAKRCSVRVVARAGRVGPHTGGI